MAGLLILAACSESSLTEPDTPPDPQTTLSGAPLAQRYARPHEEPFAGISRDVPAFGGYFFEDGNLVGYVTDLGQAAAASAALQPILHTRRVSAHEQAAGQPEVVIRQGEYSFVQLRDWRDRATDEALAIADARWIDLDEARNRVAIGLETGSGRTEVEQKLADLAIPSEAVVFEVTGEIVEETTLRDYVRPVEGGLQIQMVSQGGSFLGTCTFGFNARWNSSDVFLTNSHCTEEFWETDWTNIYQPTTASSSYRLGREDYDAAPFRCGPFYDRNDCRYSDAAIILHQTTNFNFGFIARTECCGAYGRGGVGSIEIDPDNPRMQIIAEDPYPSVGEYMDKMGRTTGWTWGEVTKTCVDVESGDIERLCQDYAKYGSGSGDSGSPVFIWGGATVTLQGIHWGSTTADGGNAIFSAMWNIEQDLGAMTVF